MSHRTNGETKSESYRAAKKLRNRGAVDDPRMDPDRYTKEQQCD